MSDGSTFRVELLVSFLRGPVGKDLSGSTAALSGATGAADRPALGLRLLDLPPVVVLAPEGETFAPTLTESEVRFNGRGKALVFRLPRNFLQRRKGPGDPLPLWLLALAVENEGSAAAVLLASTCVDLRCEVLRAAASAHRSGFAGPRPFRRAVLALTAVHDESCSLELDCYLRVCADDNQPSEAGPVLLEPAAVMDTKLSRSVVGKPRRKAEMSSEHAGTRRHGASRLGLAEGRGQHSCKDAGSSWPEQTGALGPGASAMTPADPGHRRGDLLFPGEIFFGPVAGPPPLESPAAATQPCTGGPPAKRHGTASQGLAGSASREGIGDITSDGARPAAWSGITTSPPDREGDGGTLAAPASLPFVAGLLRELWQIRAALGSAAAMDSIPNIAQADDLGGPTGELPSAHPPRPRTSAGSCAACDVLG